MKTLASGSAGRGASPGGWLVWLAAARPRTLPAAVAPVLVGCALAAREDRFAAGPALLCLGFALLVQIGTNFANDYYDFIKGADTPARVGPRRAVAAGLVAPRTMRLAMIATFAAAFLVGLGLLSRGGMPLIIVGLASIASGIAYTGGPFPLGYLGLGDFFVFLFFGPVAVASTCYVQARMIERSALLASVPIGLLAANILLVNNYRDFETDAAAGKRTLVVRFGRGFARGQFGLSLLLALATPPAFFAAGYRWPILLPLLTAPIAFGHARRLARQNSAPELIRLLGDSGKLLFVYGALLAAGLLLSR